MKDTGPALFTSQRAQEDKTPGDLEGHAVLQMENHMEYRSGGFARQTVLTPHSHPGVWKTRLCPPSCKGLSYPSSSHPPSQSANGWTVLGPRGNLCAKRLGSLEKAGCLSQKSWEGLFRKPLGYFG